MSLLPINVSSRVFDDFEEYCKNNNLDMTNTLNRVIREFLATDFVIEPFKPKTVVTEVHKPHAFGPPTGLGLLGYMDNIEEKPKKNKEDLYGE